MQFPVDSQLFTTQLKSATRGTFFQCTYLDNPVDKVMAFGELVTTTNGLSKALNEISRSKHRHFFYLKDTKGQIPVDYHFDRESNIVRLHECIFCELLKKPSPVMVYVVGTISAAHDPELKVNVNMIRSIYISLIAPEAVGKMMQYHALQVKALPLLLNDTPLDFVPGKTVVGATGAVPIGTKKVSVPFMDYKDPTLFGIQQVFENHCSKHGGQLTAEQVHNYLQDETDYWLDLSEVEEKLQAMCEKFAALYETGDSKTYSPSFPCLE